MSGSSFVGLAGAGYNSGISVYSYEWMAAIILIIFIFFILPFYLRSRVFTMPEFLEKRYDVRSRLAFSGFNLFANMFIDMAAALYAGGIVIQTLYPSIPLWVDILALSVLAGVYTVFGGLRAVVISDSIQAVVLMIGAVLISILTYRAIPSWGAVEEAAPEGALHIIQPAGDEALPWPGLFTGVLIIGIYFWTSNQLIVAAYAGSEKPRPRPLGLTVCGLSQDTATVHYGPSGNDGSRALPRPSEPRSRMAHASRLTFCRSVCGALSWRRWWRPSPLVLTRCSTRLPQWSRWTLSRRSGPTRVRRP